MNSGSGIHGLKGFRAQESGFRGSRVEGFVGFEFLCFYVQACRESKAEGFEPLQVLGFWASRFMPYRQARTLKV